LHDIYEENLRLREEVGKDPTSSASTRNQYLEDERIALMLQNEEFMAELQRDSEFMSALEMEQERALQHHYQQQQHQRVPKAGASGSSRIDDSSLILFFKIKIFVHLKVEWIRKNSEIS